MKNISLLLVLLCVLSACAHKSAPQSDNELVMLVGTISGKGGNGLYSYRFNQENGESVLLDSLALDNPTFFSLNGEKVYAITENNDMDDALCCVNLNKENGHMVVQNSQVAGCAGPCYVDCRGNMAVTAHYAGGALVKYTLDGEGNVADATIAHLGSVIGTHPNQKSAHVHCSMFSQDGRYLFMTDFSADRVLQFAVGDELVLVDSVNVRPNSGPRHITFSPDGRFAYVIGELSGEVTAFRFDNERLEKIQTIMSDTVDAQGSADIHVTRDGRFLYASNRLKADGLAIFSIDRKTGMLNKVGYQLTGIHPRNFVITPNDKYVLVACRDSNVIQVYERNVETGLLSDVKKDIVLDKPVCVRFAEKR